MASDAQPESAPAKPKRRWWQYSVRSLLALTFMVAAALAFVVSPARKQGQAVAHIEGLGGLVLYSSETEEGAPSAAGWLREAFGDRYFGTVACVSLSGKRVGDDTVAHLAGLTGLKQLALSHTGVGDAGLAHLAGLKSLEGLELNGTRVSDAGLAHLERLTMLEVLKLSETQVGDAGVAHLAGLKQLERLDLDNTQVGDTGLAHLTGLTSLKRLGLFDTRVSDRGIGKLHRALPDCEIGRDGP